MSDEKRVNTASRIIVPSRTQTQPAIPNRTRAQVQRTMTSSLPTAHPSEYMASPAAQMPITIDIGQLPMPPTLPSITTLLSLSATIRQADTLGIYTD